MQNKNYIRFNASWWPILRTLTTELRDEIFQAICVYAIDHKEPTMSALAAGIFVQIRMDIDEQVAHAAKVSQSRKQAGSRGAARTNAQRWGEVSAIADKNRQKSAIADKSSAIADNLSANADKKSAIADENSGCRQKSAIADTYIETALNNNIYNYIISSTPHHTRTHAYEIVVGWLTDDPESLLLMCVRNGLTKERLADEQLAALIGPYIEAYFNQYAFAEDWERKGRRDTKMHFSSWLPKHKTLNNDGTLHSTPGRGTGTASQGTAPNYDEEF